MSETLELEKKIAGFTEKLDELRREMARVIVGQREVIDGVFQALFAGGHVLLEGAPGLGKTKIMLELSRLLGLSFRRIQLTPDLMPADLTGSQILVKDGGGGRNFEFREGPIFANLVLADEINRATPKTQSALLEAMQERTVTTGGKTRELPKPFFVLATQNPIEMEGTYPLPEAQLDRFLLKLNIGIEGEKELVEILSRTTGNEEPELESVMGGAELLDAMKLAREVLAADAVLGFAAAVVLRTHPDRPETPESVRKYVRYGASPRAGQAMVMAAKVRALSSGRPNIGMDDLKSVAVPALRHRVILNFEGLTSGVTTDEIVLTAVDAAEKKAVYGT